MSVIRPNEKLITARLDRSLRVDPVLGDLRGATITVAVGAPESLTPGQQVIFFANSWIRGRGIAVREVSHVDIAREASVAAEIADLPRQHVIERLRSAELVVHAEIVAIDPSKPTFDQHAALWAAAHLNIFRTLRGPTRDAAVFYFPTAPWPPWDRAPRFQLNQRGVFLLHNGTSDVIAKADKTLSASDLVALDPADFQAESEATEIERSLVDRP
jgi:hypothetical protein